MNVLSIQSGVVCGHVGNATAQFCLQRLGHEVWRIDTVRFSNHPGHGPPTGDVTAPAEILRLVDGLTARGWLGACDALLTGYLGAAEQGAAILDVARRIRAANPVTIWLLDPVIGDNGRIFVKPGIPEFMRDLAVPNADIVTPNAFELAWLTGLPTGDVAAAITAARKLRGAGRQIVIATGIGDGDDLIATLAVHDDGVDIVTTPRIAITANGTGDSLAAIFLARWLATRDVAGALAHAVSSLCVLLRKTAATGARELELIAAQDAIVAPEPLHRARRIA